MLQVNKAEILQNLLNANKTPYNQILSLFKAS